ncbi:hypothetical protein AAON49_08355 [Pseudotenacibaculum sp. MALMAid0570]|uniref:hypothetical protein n=1 Tax=Pseudotenacibaculum sp. MALMAid0570 TaxID=3143938 RepID=UPI0032E031A3
MKKSILLLLFVFISYQVFSQTEDSSTLNTTKLDNKIRLTYTLVGMPTDKVNYQLEPKMGLVGLNYNVPLNKWLYTGAAMHAAVTGDQGGLFTLGVNLGVNTKLYKNLYFDANVHFGGGGGFRTLVNGGGILYPSIGLQYKKNNYSFGIQYSQVNFFTGIIKNDNFSFFLEIPSTLQKTDYKNSQKEFVLNNNSKDEFWKKTGVKSVQQVTFDYFFPIGLSRKDATESFEPINNTLSIVGFEYQRYLNSNTFIYVHTDAMYQGLISGFMDLFIGAGKNFVETKHVNFFGKFGIGAAGGRIYPEDGLTMYPSIGADIKFTEKFGLSLHGGYHRSIGATFEAYTAGFSFKYYGLSGGTVDPFSLEEAAKIKAQGMQIGVQNQTYYDVAKFGIPDSDLQLIAIKINYDVTRRFYFSGEASFAYEGRSGGYAHGLFGLGIKTNRFFNQKLSSFFEVGLGVAGGGRVDAGEGILVRPIVGLNYHLNDDFSLQVSGGQIIAPYGNVNSSNINVGLTYSFSMLNAKNN